MEIALTEAKLAGKRDEVPVGAVIVDKDYNILATNGNRILELEDPTAHAEILCIREASKKMKNERLVGCTIYTSLEPCAMCASAISLARIKRLYFGAFDNKTGGVENGIKFFESSSCMAIELYPPFEYPITKRFSFSSMSFSQEKACTPSTMSKSTFPLLF